MPRAIVNGITREVPPLRLLIEPLPKAAALPQSRASLSRKLATNVILAWGLVALQIPVVLIDVTNQFAVACAAFTVFCAVLTTRWS